VTPYRRILFALSGKLGDTVACYATVRAYADAFPADEVTLLVRARYAPLFAREAGVRVIGFSGRVAMLAKLLARRWREPAYDALLVLLGSGAQTRDLGRLVRARRKIFVDGRFRDVYPEWPEIPAGHLHSEPAWRVARLFEPRLAQPLRASIPSLAALRRPGPIVAIAPASDETRRSMTPACLRQLAASLPARHPGRELRVLINPADRDAQPLLAAGLPEGACWERFADLPALVAALRGLEHLHATDSGVYHLAAAMGVPTTAYYGPTQPWKNAFPAQAGLTRVRLAALGGDHCEEKQCRDPVCLSRAIALHAGSSTPAHALQEQTPPGCLLRRHSAAELERLAVLGPSVQAPGREPVPVH
jgi:ADP-heptose:LPS heptosyltransferase